MRAFRTRADFSALSLSKPRPMVDPCGVVPIDRLSLMNRMASPSCFSTGSVETLPGFWKNGSPSARTALSFTSRLPMMLASVWATSPGAGGWDWRSCIPPTRGW